MPFQRDWAKLWQLAERVAGGIQEEPSYVFMPVGSALEDPNLARAWDYQSTPTNVVTFASTGGDGVHFSIVDPDEPNGPRRWS